MSDTGKHLTADEWRALVASDPVLRFIEGVNKAASQHPLWSVNYALALYETFGDHARWYTEHVHNVASYEIELAELLP